MKKTILATAVAGALALTITGCSSWTTDQAVSGKAIDGYLKGMECTVAGAATPSVTNEKGEFKILAKDAQSKDIVCSSTANSVDMATGSPFQGQLKAPAGYTNVTPVTTLVAALRGNAASVAEAEATAREILGIPAGQSLDVDPYDKPEIMFKAVQTVHQIVNTITQAVLSKNNGLNANTVYANAIQNLVNAVTAAKAGGKTVDLTNTDDVRTITHAAAESTGISEGVTINATAVANAAQVIVAAIPSVATGTTAEQLNNKQKEVKNISNTELDRIGVAPNRPTPTPDEPTGAQTGATGGANNTGAGAGI